MTEAELIKHLRPIIKRCVKMLRKGNPEELVGKLAILTAESQKEDANSADQFLELAILTKLVLLDDSE